MGEGVHAIWRLINGPDNDAVVIGLALGWFGLLVGYLTMFRSYRRVLREKDARIDDLVDQRNLFQGIALSHRGIERKSTDDHKSGKGKGRKP